MYPLRRRPLPPISAPADVAERQDPATQRILVVEDNDCLRAVAVRTLSARGYAVAEARHGEDALRVI
jgi:ActR/RegA family two-component response regulator